MISTFDRPLITPTFFPRSMMDMDLPGSSLLNRPLWDIGAQFNNLYSSVFDRPFDQLSLDVFDPFSDIDRMMNRNISWLNEPDFLPSRIRAPIIPQKYRITLDCAGYNQSSLKSEVKGRTLTISGSEGDPALKGSENYSIKEFKKTYDLPNYVDASKLVSFMTNDGVLVVEFPFINQGLESLLPKVDEKNKLVELDVAIPDNVDPTKVSVTCRDHDITIKADYRVKNEDGSSRSKIHYLRRSTLPENTNWNTLKCEMDENNVLKCTAALGPHHRKRVPIEFKQSAGSIQGQQQMQQ